MFQLGKHPELVVQGAGGAGDGDPRRLVRMLLCLPTRLAFHPLASNGEIGANLNDRLPSVTENLKEKMMEWFAMLLIVLVITLLVGGAFAAAGMRGPWPGVLWFLLVLFLATLTIGAWVEPVGPRAWDVPWLTFLVTALLIALLIAAATPRGRDPQRYRSPTELRLNRDPNPEDPNVVSDADQRQEVAEQESEAAAAATAVGIFFWFFLVLTGTILLLNLLVDTAV